MLTPFLQAGDGNCSFRRPMEQAIQIVGAFLVLSAYAGAQLDRLDQRSIAYLTLNLVGSAALAILAAIGGQFGFLLLEGVWAIVSLWSLSAVLRARESPGT
jgi:hypothetical protein